MVERYKEVHIGGEGEIVEKKSRFIATVCAIQTEDEAIAFIESTKKKYWDAKHNCSAFVLGMNSEISRCSDDGEPSGTAGRPMLEVLLGAEVRNTAVVVTRYFGGTLLGTGGLVRAYTKAVQRGLEESVIAEYRFCLRMELLIDYNGIGKVQYILAKGNYLITASDYAETIRVEVLLPEGEAQGVIAELVEATNGRIEAKEIGKGYCAVVNGELSTERHFFVDINLTV